MSSENTLDHSSIRARPPGIQLIAIFKTFTIKFFITYAISSRRLRFSTASVCLSVFRHDISKTAAARITKHEFWKSRRSKVKVTKTQTVLTWVYTLVSAGFF